MVASANAALVARVSEDGQQQLVTRIRAGDEQAFETLFRSYHRPLYAFLRTYLHSRALAEELVQDVLLWIWVRRAEWQVQGDLRSYLYRAARNRALTHLRHHRSAVRRETLESFDDRSLAGLSEGPRRPDQIVYDREIIQAVKQAVQALPDRRREAYTLRWQHDLTIPQIAQVMGVSTKCVERQLTLATKALRAGLLPLRA